MHIAAYGYVMHCKYQHIATKSYYTYLQLVQALRYEPALAAFGTIRARTVPAMTQSNINCV